MKRILCGCGLIVAGLIGLTPGCAADDRALAQRQENYTVSLDLKFSRKEQNTLLRAISLLDVGPNGYATGFGVGHELIMTAYHVVSGNLSAAKKLQLGFAANDELVVKVMIGDCQATVVSVDRAADLALLRGCRAQPDAPAPAFQPSPAPAARLLLIARPHGRKMVHWGTFTGPYMVRELQYWSAHIDGRDGYSGSPVYNDRAELVGVFSGYDWAKQLAVISPGGSAQKLLTDYLASRQP